MSAKSQPADPVERWFIGRGVPHFIAGYNAREDVLTRALPILTIIFLFSAISAIDVDWPAWGIGLAIAGGFALLLTVWAGINRLRGRRPLAPPTRIGTPEIATFVLVPSLLPIVFGADFRGAGITLLSQIALLGLVYLATSYGLVAISSWALRQAWHSLGQTIGLFAKGLPLLLLGFMFLFVNAEAWQSAGRLEPALLYAVVGLFVVLGTAFVVTHIPREIGESGWFMTWQEVSDLAAGTPVAETGAARAERPDPPPLTRREWGNLGLVVLVSQGLRIVLVAGLVGLFFVLFGLLTIRPDTLAGWTGADPTTVGVAFSWFGHDVQLTTELLKVSTFLAAFAGLYFSVYTITDATFRQEFFEDIVEDVRTNLAVRALYRARID